MGRPRDRLRAQAEAEAEAMTAPGASPRAEARLTQRHPRPDTAATQPSVRWRLKLSKAIEAFIDELRATGKAESTCVAYESHLRRLARPNYRPDGPACSSAVSCRPSGARPPVVVTKGGRRAPEQP